MIVATGSSNRQTKALASSVRESVKARGLQVMATEGEDNGEWIIVDCGAAVVHIMQPTIREYYHLEEIWGGKTVRLKPGAVRTGLVKASEPMDEPAPATKGAARKTTRAGAGVASRPPARAAAKTPVNTPAKTVRKTPAKTTATKAVTAKTPARRGGQAAAADVPPSSARRRSTPAVQTVVVKPSGKTTGAKAGAKPAAKTSAKPAAKPAGRAPAKAAPRAAAKSRTSRG